MKMKNIRLLGLLLGLSILVILLVFRDSMNALLAGLPYFMAADILCIACISLAQGSDRRTLAEGDLSPRHVRAYILLLMAGQLTIVATLNVAVVDSPRLHIPFIFDYLLVGAFLILSYKVLSIVDSPKQNGGYIPLAFWGVQRSRRFFLVVFAGYCTVCPLAIASLEFSVGSGGWQPVAFQPPEACVLMVAIMSVISAGLTYQRYRCVATINKARRSKILGMTLLFLVCAAGLQHIFSYGIYVYGLSAVTIISIAISTSCMWQIGENAQDSLRSPHPEPTSGESPLRS